MLLSTLIVSAQLSLLAYAAPTAPISDSTTLPPLQNPNSVANNKEIIDSLQLATLARDRINMITEDKNFVFDFNNPPENAISTGKGGRTVSANRATFPAGVIGNGGAMTLGFLGPCGFNTPHIHPRSAEFNIPVKGSLVTQFTTENGARTVSNRVGTNQLTVFPQGAIHTEFNPDCTDALFVASFASEDPGVQQTAQTFFGLNDDILEATLGQDVYDGADLDQFRSMIPANVAEGVEQCLKTCGIAKR